MDDPTNSAGAAASSSELIGGKFESQEALLTAYHELEKKLGASTSSEDEELQTDDKGEVEPQDKAEDKDTAQEPDPYGPIVSEALNSAGLDADEVNSHFWTKGELSDDHYAQLEEAGFGRDMVDVYLHGLKTMAQNGEEATNAQIKEIVNEVGGREELVKMAKWAKSHAPEAAAAYDRVMETGDPYMARLAVQDLYNQFTASAGTGTKGLFRGRQGPNSAGPQPFGSRAELVEAMSDPRYKNDEAYAASVSERLKVSNLFPKHRKR